MLIHKFLLDSLKLPLDYEYNLNAVKEIKVTESFLGLEEHVKNCQTEEAIEDCKSKHYIDNLLQQCKCIPLSIRTNDKVDPDVVFNCKVKASKLNNVKFL